jgi:nitronate monooxygenase
MSHPLIIQGGMGAGVSSWQLANSVSRLGQLGVVSGIGIDIALSRILQMGDLEGHFRRALGHFPIPEVAERVMKKYFVEGGIKKGDPVKPSPMFTVSPGKPLTELLVVSNFVEVFLAKEGHNNPVGINYLEKVQMPCLHSIYGAMLAGVDYILMGAGIPREVPGVLDKFAKHEEATYKLNVIGATLEDNIRSIFNPKSLTDKLLPNLKRPKFLAIISSAILAITMSRKATGSVEGFIIEAPTAGGHNAPPRGNKIDEKGEPLYGPKDVPDLEKIKSLGYPIWLAGSYGAPEKLEEAKNLGAAGIQVGTLFAFTKESGFTNEVKRDALKKVFHNEAKVFTDPLASPTGFPFKVLQLEGTLSEEEQYKNRKRICDMGYLRHIYKKEDGTIGYRCPSEPVEDYVKKGGAIEDTVGRKCLCNGLLSNIGLAKTQKDGYVEEPLVTAGDEINKINNLIKSEDDSYTAEDVINYLLGKK